MWMRVWITFSFDLTQRYCCYDKTSVKITIIPKWEKQDPTNAKRISWISKSKMLLSWHYIDVAFIGRFYFADEFKRWSMHLNDYWQRKVFNCLWNSVLKLHQKQWTQRLSKRTLYFLRMPFKKRFAFFISFLQLISYIFCL